MKRSCLVGLVLLITLSACDFVSRFVPPIEVGDVFGIGSPESPTTLKVPAFQDPTALGPFLPAATGAADLEETEITFANLSLPDMYGFTLDALWVTLGIGNTIILERVDESAAYPESFTLTAVEAYVHVSDAENVREPVEYHFTEQGLELTFTRQGPCGHAASCEYKATASTTELQNAMLFQIPERDGRTVKDLITIATEGGENHARIKARLTADAPTGSLEGLAATIQLMNTSTKVSLGG